MRSNGFVIWVHRCGVRVGFIGSAVWTPPPATRAEVGGWTPNFLKWEMMSMGLYIVPRKCPYLDFCFATLGYIGLVTCVSFVLQFSYLRFAVYGGKLTSNE